MGKSLVFFEVQNWEKEMLQKDFPDAAFVIGPINSENVKEYADATVLSCFIYSTIQKDIIDALPHLRCIATRSTGYDHIDIAYCKQKSIVVMNVPEYGSNTVAEHTFALLLNLTRKIYQAVNQSKGLNFGHTELRGVDINEKVIGIIGLGKIGKQVMRIAKGFGMHILVYNRTHDEDLATTEGFRYVELDELLTLSDVVTLHLPIIPETKHLINKSNVVKMKKGSYLINTARGGLVDTEAIILGLQSDIIAGVGLDVLEEEKELTEEVAVLSDLYTKQVDLKTLVYNHILINHPKVLYTPHNAFNSIEALMRIAKTTAENITAFEKGEAIHTI